MLLYVGRDDKSWKHLATFRTLTNGSPLSGLYSFIEDFRRDGKSLQQSRRATFGHGWVKTVGGDWQPLTKARFTADATPVMNMDAGVKDFRFWLATGGEVRNQTALKSLIEVEAKSTEPPELP